jgi:hypothetical protein
VIVMAASIIAAVPERDETGQDRGETTFDDAAIERLRLAAEEVAWLTGRGYAVETVSELVAAHHALSPAQRAALARGTCSEPQYRRRAAREIEAEDVPRTKAPLAVDAIDVVACVEAALSGRPVLQTLDGTVRAFDAPRATYAPGPRAGEAIDLVLAAAKELRPKGLRFVVDEGAAGAAPLRAALEDRARSAKAKIEVLLAPSAAAALKKERQVVSGDAAILDASAGWINLVGRVVEAIPGAKIVRLQ